MVYKGVTQSVIHRPEMEHRAGAQKLPQQPNMTATWHCCTIQAHEEHKVLLYMV